MRGSFLIATLLLALGLSGSAAAIQADAQDLSAREQLQQRQVLALVHLFGEQLVHVSLLAPAREVERQMLEHYGPYVSDDLLSSWLAAPQAAPGRVTSSPWPERIVVHEIERLGNKRYMVSGEIILVTSAEVAAGDDAAAAIQAVRMRIERRGGPWQITELELDTPGGVTSTAAGQTGKSPDEADPTQAELPFGREVSVSGEIVCLPKKGDGPVTMECAYGLRANEGHHFGLTELPEEALGGPGGVRTGSYVTVTGPLSAPDPDTAYDIVGAIRVDEMDWAEPPGREAEQEETAQDESGQDESGQEEKQTEQMKDWQLVETDAFTFRHPQDFRVINSDDALPPASIPPCSSGFTTCAYYDGNVLTDTNFVSAGVGIRRSEVNRPECESTEGDYAVVQNVRNETLGETDYLVFETAEAGMHKAARDIIYRSWREAGCFEIAARIASANFSVYEPGTIREFTAAQQAELRETLTRIVGSVEFGD